MQITVYQTDGPHDPQEATADQLTALLGQPNTLVWVDMLGPSADDVRILRDVFRFHPLAIEDTTNHRQRPKVDEYDGYLFVILNAATLTQNRLDVRELDVFVGGNYLVTVHAAGEPVIAQASRRLADAAHHHAASAGWALYMLVDVVVDAYFPILDALGDQIEAIGDRILDNPRRDALEELFLLKRSLTEIWRVTGQQRDSFAILMRELPIQLFGESMIPYLRDVYDHLLRINDTVNTFRDSATNVLDVYMSAVSNRLNVQVNRLTIITIGIGLITVVAGFYGMNFIHTWPPFESYLGVPVVLAFIVATIIGIVVALRNMDRL